MYYCFFKRSTLLVDRRTDRSWQWIDSLGRTYSNRRKFIKIRPKILYTLTFWLPPEVFIGRMKISPLQSVLGAVTSGCAEKTVVSTRNWVVPHGSELVEVETSRYAIFSVASNEFNDILHWETCRYDFFLNGISVSGKIFRWRHKTAIWRAALSQSQPLPVSPSLS